MPLTYKRTVTISKSSSGTLINYPEMITVNTATPISAGKMQADGDDIRLYSATGTLLKHWIMPGTINTATTRIFVKVPTMIGSGNTLIYLYYGDVDLTNVESGTNTFAFFDDFLGSNDDALNGTRWPTISGTWTIQSNSAYSTVANGTASAKGPTQDFDRPARTVFKFKSSNVQEESHAAMTLYASLGLYGYGVQKIYVGSPSFTYKSYAQAYYNGSGVVNVNGPTRYINDTWYTQMGILTDSVTQLFYDYLIDPALEIHATESSSNTIYPQVLITAGHVATNIYLDYIATMAYNADVSNVVGAEGYLGPIISSVTPSTAVEGESKTLTVVGFNFEDSCAVTLEKTGETDITATDVDVDLDGEGLTCDVDTTDGAIGWWDMRIVNP